MTCEVLCTIAHTHSHIGLTKQYLYTVNHKKRGSLFLTIPLANLNKFLWFLYHFNRE